jgi:hypothetical protein
MTNTSARTNNLPRILGVFACVCVIAALAVASLWQGSVQNSRLDDAESHALVSAYIADARDEGNMAAVLLNEYIVSGDAELIPEIQTHAAAGVQALSAAVDEAGSDEGEFLSRGSTAIEGVGQIIALREAGDSAAAAAALEQLSPAFNGLVADLDEFATEQEELSASAIDSAESADTLGSWLAVAAGSVALVLGLTMAVTVAQGIRRRRTVGAPTSL